MNVCFEGYCCCDAAEWEGDTYCDAYYGKTEKDEPLEDRYSGPPAYYFDERYGVVLSIDPSERIKGVKYFSDPHLKYKYKS